MHDTDKHPVPDVARHYCTSPIPHNKFVLRILPSPDVSTFPVRQNRIRTYGPQAWNRGDCEKKNECSTFTGRALCTNNREQTGTQSANHLKLKVFVEELFSKSRARNDNVCLPSVSSGTEKYTVPLGIVSRYRSIIIIQIISQHRTAVDTKRKIMPDTIANRIDTIRIFQFRHKQRGGIGLSTGTKVRRIQINGYLRSLMCPSEKHHHPFHPPGKRSKAPPAS